MKTLHSIIGKTEIVLIAAVLGVMLSASACTSESDGSVGVSAAGIGGVEPEGDCDYFHTNLKTSTGLSPGFVKMWNDGTALVLSVRAEGGWTDGSWLIKDVTVQVGDCFEDFGDLSGSPQPTSSWVIPLTDLCAGCGDTLQVIVRATLIRGDEIVVAWGYGTELPEESCMPSVDEMAFIYPTPPEPYTCGWSFEYTICCEESSGCTLTQGFWKTHAEAWPVSSLWIGGVLYDQDALLAILNTPPRGDASLILAHQYIAALLNFASGASAGADVDTALADADMWFMDHADADGLLPFAVRASSPAGAEATELSGVLGSFNEGSAGTPHCDDGPVDDAD
jgi:hypothetical protein